MEATSTLTATMTPMTTSGLICFSRLGFSLEDRLWKSSRTPATARLAQVARPPAMSLFLYLYKVLTNAGRGVTRTGCKPTSASYCNHMLFGSPQGCQSRRYSHRVHAQLRFLQPLIIWRSPRVPVAARLAQGASPALLHVVTICYFEVLKGASRGETRTGCTPSSVSFNRLLFGPRGCQSRRDSHSHPFFRLPTIENPYVIL